MIHIAIRVRELVSSNVDTLVSKAGDQHKMLRLLQSEIEEALIGLHGDVTKSRREHERRVKAADELEKTAEAWSAKAKTAVDHGREDLARAALLARESDRKKVVAMRDEAETLAEQIDEMDAAIAELEGKRESVGDRMAEVAANSAKATTSSSSGDSRTARKMDRINALDRRASFASSDEDLSPAAVEAEIAELQKASAIEAELEAMKAPAPAKRSRKKTK